MFDVIGDIHGYDQGLKRLMVGMGYEDKGDIYIPPSDRRPFFIGDFIDRGRGNREVVTCVRNMVEARHADAIMGNHEYNAVLWTLPDRKNPGDYLRQHSDKNRSQHQEFLDEMECDPDFYRQTIDWFRSLPIYKIHDGKRFIHACWHEESIRLLERQGCLRTDGTLTDKAWQEAGNEGSPCYKALELLLKGPEEELGEAASYIDAHGASRSKARLAWWAENPQTVGETYASLPEGFPGMDLPYEAVAPHEAIDEIRAGLKRLDEGEHVFIGHYWQKGEPDISTDKVACVDWNLPEGRPTIAAYRMQTGEKELDRHNYFWAPGI